VTLGSDDPSFFGTTIGREYEIAQEKFGFSDAELLRVTRNAVEEAFVDATTRASLLARIDDAESNMP
jgi:adenosine deaminase